MKRIICICLLLKIGKMFSQADTSRASPEERDSLNFNFFSATGDDINTDIEQQDISSLLQSSRDVFSQFSNFQFSAAAYRLRGAAAQQQNILFNGIKLENPENGFSSLSSLSGLNDVTRNVETGLGISANRSSFSGNGGYLNIDSKAGTFKKGTRFSYSNANRIFRHRSMLTQSSGVMKNGWALLISASTRQGNQIYRPGTHYNASAFYLALDKQIKDRHTFSLIAFAAPTERGGFAFEPKEAYQLTKTNYYNSQWGFQNGKIRNAAVNKSFRPTVVASHNHKITSTSRLNTSVFYAFGKTSLTGLNWANASDPRPDYYSHLPSYFYNKGDSAGGDALYETWKNDINTRQINWDKLISANQDNLFTLPIQNGQAINTNESRARYIVEERVEKLNHYGFTTIYNKRVANLFISWGVNGAVYENRKYKMVNDLLGATFWLDYDLFAQRLGVDPMFKQNNLDEPDKKIYKNERFGYDYTIRINSAETWVQLDHSFRKWEIYGAMSGSYRNAWRTGWMANGKFPEKSKGNSPKISFMNYGAKIGATYKLSGRQFITFNSLAQTTAPEINNIFISQTTRNEFVNDLKPAKLTSADLNYYIKLPTLKVRLSVYYTQMSNLMWHRIYYSEQYNTNINLVMKNIKQNSTGLELGFEKTLFDRHIIQIAVGSGEFIYSNRPTLEAWQDNNSKALFANRLVYLKNYKTGSTPQTVGGCGYKYNTKKWFAGIYFNYFDQIIVEANPDRRTEEALSAYFENESHIYNKVTQQEKLPAYFTLNANAGRSFRLYKKYSLHVNLSINNLLNDKKNIMVGREQLRWDSANIDKFPNRYTYMPGITYMAILNLSF